MGVWTIGVSEATFTLFPKTVVSGGQRYKKSSEMYLFAAFQMLLFDKSVLQNACIGVEKSKDMLKK